MSTHQDSKQAELRRIIDALHAAWQVESAKVAEFGLHAQEDAIRPAYGGWSVPVWSDVPTGSARDLVQTLGRIQDIVETQSNLSISLYLDPFAKAG